MTCPASLAANHKAIMNTGALQEPVATLKAAGCVGGDCASHGTAAPLTNLAQTQTKDISHG
jgi:hypothetical protein